MQCINFVLSYFSICHNFTGLIEFIPLAIIGYLYWANSERQLHPEESVPKRLSIQGLATTALVSLSLRLGLFLLYRMRSRLAVDTRLGKTKQRNVQSVCSILKFWLIHGEWGVFCSLPVTLLNSKTLVATHTGHEASAKEIEHNSIDLKPVNDSLREYYKESEITIMQYCALIVWFLGFLIEALADHTKLNTYNKIFLEKENCSNNNKYYNMNGHFLWRYSRNPNFFGECMCWLGIGLSAAMEFYPETDFTALLSFDVTNTANVKFFLCWLSPLFTLGIMLGEAVLLSEWKNNRRYRSKNYAEGNSDYDAYKRCTSLLIPIPPELYVKLPNTIRKIFFFDWDIYEKSRNPNTLIVITKEEHNKEK